MEAALAAGRQAVTLGRPAHLESRQLLLRLQLSSCLKIRQDGVCADVSFKGFMPLDVTPLLANASCQLVAHRILKLLWATTCSAALHATHLLPLCLFLLLHMRVPAALLADGLHGRQR